MKQKLKSKFEDFDFQQWGEYFGYPQCCIDSFMTLEHVGGPRRKLSGTGYVPCKECDQKSEEELIVALSVNRKCSLPFPEED